jgi:hypothetical protein
MGFKMSMRDRCLYVKNVDTDNAMFILAYVDFLLVGQRANIDKAVATPMEKWKKTDAGSAKWLLGMHIEHTLSLLALSPQAYIDSLADRYHLDSFRLISTPTQRTMVPAPSTDLRADVRKYQSLVGALMWLSLGTRPDITFATNVLCRFNTDPSRHQFNEAIRVLRYVYATKT